MTHQQETISLIGAKLIAIEKDIWVFENEIENRDDRTIRIIDYIAYDMVHQRNLAMRVNVDCYSNYTPDEHIEYVIKMMLEHRALKFNHDEKSYIPRDGESCM